MFPSQNLLQAIQLPSGNVSWKWQTLHWRTPETQSTQLSTNRSQDENRKHMCLFVFFLKTNTFSHLYWWFVRMILVAWVDSVHPWMYRQCIDRYSRRDSHILFHLQRQSPEKLQRFQPGLRGGTKLTTSRMFSPVTSHSPGTTHLHSGGPFNCLASRFQRLASYY